MNQQSTIEKEYFFENNNKGIEHLTSLLSIEDQVVMESTANLWLPLYEAINNKHIKVVLANPMKTKAIASAKVKTDKADAKILATY
jgi:transposase